jgi:hypothetical protein
MTGLVTVRIGDPYRADISRDSQRVREIAIDQITGAIVKRTQRRLRQNGSERLAQAVGYDVTGSSRSVIRSNYGGPGIIRPVRKQALFWPGARHPVKFVNGKGIEPLIRAEARRLRSLPNVDITIN